MTNWNDEVIAQFRAGEARIANRFDREGLVLLHTTGARTGQERISPLAVFRVEGKLAIVASAAGAPENPAWYFNLRKNPRVTIEIAEGDGIATRSLVAEDATGEHRDRLWRQLVAAAPGFGDYQEKTTRVIPVVLLDEPAGEGPASSG